MIILLFIFLLLLPEAGHAESWELAYGDDALYEWLLGHTLH